MFEVPIQKLKSDEGLEKILERMSFYYAKKSENSPWSTFSKWFTRYRSKDETVESYARKFMSLFTEIQTHDGEVKCSRCWQ